MHTSQKQQVNRAFKLFWHYKLDYEPCKKKEGGVTLPKQQTARRQGPPSSVHPGPGMLSAERK